MRAYLDTLIAYGRNTGLVEEGDETYVYNRLLEILHLDEA